MHVRQAPDLWIPACTVALLAIGVVMVHSAGTVASTLRYHDAFYHVKRQLLWAGIGLISMLVVSRIDYRLYQRHAKLILGGSVVLLLLVLLPHVGQVRNGSRAWIGLGTFGVQPSEFAKFSLIIFLSWYFTRDPDRIQSFRRGLLPPLAFVGAIAGLIMLEPDLGQTAVLIGSALVLIFVAGARLSHLTALAAAGLLGFAALVAAAPYRLARVISFVDPWKYPDTTGYHVIMSLIALGRGALLGVGIGASTQKQLYLPEPQTDFIFAILTEELGLIGAAVALFLFGTLLWRGLRAALRAPDRFGTYLATGLTAIVGVQVFVNVGVVTGLLPVTGITLPFISYGGSSLTLMLTAMGILMSISRAAQA